MDAGFIWTEPHSKRIRMKLTVQKDVLNGVKLQQVFAVEFLVQNQQCDACQRSYTEHTWRASVQVRQRVEHKRTFYLLEQLILKHGMHEKCINVEQVPEGIDFFFSERSHALKFLDFLGAMVPLRHRQANARTAAKHDQAFSIQSHDVTVGRVANARMGSTSRCFQRIFIIM